METISGKVLEVLRLSGRQTHVHHSRRHQDMEFRLIHGNMDCLDQAHKRYISETIMFLNTARKNKKIMKNVVRKPLSSSFKSFLLYVFSQKFYYGKLLKHGACLVIPPPSSFKISMERSVIMVNMIQLGHSWHVPKK